MVPMDLGKRIQHYYRQGLTRSETFQKICFDMDLPPVSDEQLSDWFRNIDEKLEDADYPANYSHYTLVMRIAEETGKLKNVIAVWSQSDISYQTFNFLSSRYALTFCGYKPQTALWLLDNFHKEKRKMHVEGQFPEGFDIGDCTLWVVDIEFILLCERTSLSSNSFYIYLLKLNLPEAKCTLVDSHSLVGRNRNIIFDCELRHRFYVYFSDNETDAYYLQEIKIENSRLHVAPQSTHFDYQFKCERIEGSSFQTFHFAPDQEVEEDEDVGWKEVFGEFKLVPGQEVSFQELFDKKMDSKLMDLRWVRHSWFNTRCYILARHFKQPYQMLLIFDLETQEITTTECNFHSDDQLMDMHIDQEEKTVTLCMKNQENSGHSYLIRRFKLSEPESLANLALFKLRKEKIFYGNEAYYQVANFPNNLRPLAVCPPK